MATDAVTLIMNDHRVMEQLFERLKAGDGDPAALIAEVKARLTAHSEAEETQVYPALKQADPGEADEVDHAYDEHEEAQQLLSQLAAARPGGAEFDRMLTAFVDAVTHHVEEEESEVLPALRQAVDSRTLEQLGDRFEEVRRGMLEQAGMSGGPSPDTSRAELYEQARQADISGRSTMSKDELAEALRDQRS
jgi:hemerythrin superfamily protein